MNHGYVKFWRKALDAGWLKNHELWVFWSYCLLKASHKKYTVIVGCQRVDLLPGQFVMGRRKASEETGLTEREIRTCLALLKKWENVTSRTTNKFTVITVINWNAYQSNKTANDQHNDQQATSGRPHTNTEEHKNKIFSSDSIEIRLTELLLEKIILRNLNFKKPNLQIWAKDVDLMIRIDSRTPEDIRRVIEWCQSDPFWQNNILSTAKLRKQFDQLRLKMGTDGEKAVTVPSPPPLSCPRCGRELVVKNDLYGDGCIHCQRALEVRS